MRHFAAQPRPMLVHSRAQRGNPAKPAFHDHDAKLRKPLEHAFEYQAGQHRLHGLCDRVMLFHVIGRPATAGGRMTVGAADMNRDRQIVAHRRLKDRPVAAPARDGSSVRGRTRICVKFGSPPRASISAHRSLRCLPARQGPRPAAAARSSPSAPPAMCSSPCVSAAPKSRFRWLPGFQRSGISIPTSTPLGSRCCFLISSRLEPGRAAFFGIGIDPRRIRRHARMRQRFGKGVAQMTAIDRKMLDPSFFAR